MGKYHRVRLDPTIGLHARLYLEAQRRRISINRLIYELALRWLDWHSSHELPPDDEDRLSLAARIPEATYQRLHNSARAARRSDKDHLTYILDSLLLKDKPDVNSNE